MYTTFSADLVITAGSTINQMDESYLNVFQAHLNPITSSIPPQVESLTSSFTGLSTQEFQYEDNTLQNQTDVIEINKCS